MKYIKYIILSGLFGFTMWACSDDDNQGPVIHKNGGLAITTPGSNDTWVLKDTTADVINTINWSPVDYGFAAGTSYKVEIDVNGSNFAEPATLAVVNATSAGIAQGDLNNILLAKELDGEFPVLIDMRVIANLDNDVTPDTSPVVTFTVVPYSSTVVIPQLGVPGSYQNWSPADSTTAVYSPKSNGLYEGYVHFNIDDAKFKYTQGPTWDTNWGDSGNDGTLDPGGADIPAGAAGVYKLNADLNGLTHSFLRTDWGLIGSATPNGWDADQDMAYDPASKKYSITLDLVPGAIKFRVNDDWAINLGDNGNNKSLEYNGTDIPVAEAGNYTIDMFIVGLPKYKYTITKN